MRTKLLKKIYLKKKINNYLKEKEFILFIQYQNIPLKNRLVLKKKLNDLNMKIRLVNITFKSIGANIFTRGQSSILYPENKKNINLEHFFKLLEIIKQEKILLLSIKYKQNIYNLNTFVQLLKYKNNKNILFLLFMLLNTIKNPNKNLI